MKLPNKRRSGFTLIELLVVVSIIGILASLAIFATSGYADRAKTAEATNTLGALSRAIRINWDDNGVGTRRCLPANFVTTNAIDGTKNTLVAADQDAMRAGGLGISDKVYYRYELRAGVGSSGGCMVAAPTEGATVAELFAIHDFDGDGTVSAWSMNLVAKEDGSIGPNSNGIHLLSTYTP